jgi:hypothetical protein
MGAAVKFLRSLLKKNIATEQTTHQRVQGANWKETVKPLSGYAWLIVALGSFLITGFWFFALHLISYEYDRTITATSKDTMNLARA